MQATVDVTADPRPVTVLGTTDVLGSVDGPEPVARTLVVAGGGPGPWTAYAALAAERRGWPVVAEASAGFGVIAVPHGALLLEAPEWLDAHLPDQVVVVGNPTLHRSVQRLLARPDVEVIVVAATPRWPDAARAATRVVAPGWLRAVADLPGPVDEHLKQDWLDAGAAAARAVTAVTRRDGALGWPGGAAVARATLAALPPQAVLQVASSNPVRDVDLAATPRADVAVLVNRGLAGIDGTLASATGAALALAPRPAYALVGDLAFLHDLNGLLIGPHEPQPDLTVVVCNDDGGGIFAHPRAGWRRCPARLRAGVRHPDRRVDRLARRGGGGGLRAGVRSRRPRRRARPDTTRRHRGRGRDLPRRPGRRGPRPGRRGPHRPAGGHMTGLAAAFTEVAGYADRWLAFRQQSLRLPGVQAAVWVDGELVLSTAHGHADVAAGTALTPAHLFRVASHSKTFTATAVAKLAQDGRLGLDDRLDTHLPWTSTTGLGDRTLAQLLSHTGGVRRDGREADHWQLAGPFPDDAGLQALVAAADVVPADERFKYSNLAFGLLGAVVAAVSGRSYREYVAAEVVAPLGLADTAPDLLPDRLADYARGYSALAYAEHRVPIEHVDTGALDAATGFTSTAADLAHWGAAHLPGERSGGTGCSVQRCSAGCGVRRSTSTGTTPRPGGTASASTCARCTAVRRSATAAATRATAPGSSCCPRIG